MALNDLTRRAASTHMADLAAEDESDRYARYQRAWEAYDGEGPLPFEDGSPDNVRLDYAKLIVDKGVSFLAGKGGVEFQIGPEVDDSDLDEQLADLAREEEQTASEPPPEPPAAPQPEQPESAPAPPGQPDQPVQPDQAALDAEHEQAVREHAQQQQENLDRIARKRRMLLQQKQERDARRALDEAWPEEQRHLDFHQLAVNGGVCGHFWLRLHETGRVSVVDPGNVTVIWHEDDVDVVLEYHVQWNTVDSETGLGVVRRKRFVPDDPEDPTAWTIYDEELDEDTGEWLEIDETDWPHPFSPLVGGQNLPAPNTYYGNADLECAVLDQIEQLQSIASDMRRIVRLHGHPVPVVIGEEASRLSQIGVAIGDLLAIPNKDAKLDQLQIAELESSMSLFQEVKTSLFEGSHIPKVALGDTTNAGPTAAVALQVEYAPLVERTETKRLTYGPVLRQTAENVLELLGYKGWRVTLGWPQLLPVDEAAEVASAEADLRMGVASKQTISEKRGYDWKVESQRLEDQNVGQPDTTDRLLEQLANHDQPTPGVPGA